VTLLNGNLTIPQENMTYYPNNPQCQWATIKTGLLALSLFITPIGMNNSTGYGSKSFTSCIEYSKAGILNVGQLEMKVRAIEMVANQYQAPGEKKTIESAEKQKINPRQYALTLLKKSEEEWEIYTKAEANLLHPFYDGGDIC